MKTTYKNIDKTLVKVGDKVETAWGEVVNQHKATGELSRSINFKVKNQILIMEIGPEAEFLDAGRKPGKMPPISELNNWANIKGINVWALAKSIAKKGTQPYPFLDKYETIFKDAKKDITKAGKKDIIDNSNKILKNQTGIINLEI